MRKAVCIESPFKAATPDLLRRNIAYARLAVLDCLYRGEAPIASHLLLTQVLDDTDPAQREMGISAGLIWQARADIVAFYVDLGMSGGMQAALVAAETAGRATEQRSIAGWQPLLDADADLSDVRFRW